ncbi:hypothetical protein KFU94_42600 [Chloroflexi bacterium TSY]|nr:hypothetical protein [Chloroflexi bacterium TSY]
MIRKATCSDREATIGAVQPVALAACRERQAEYNEGQPWSAWVSGPGAQGLIR